MKFQRMMISMIFQGSRILPLWTKQLFDARTYPEVKHAIQSGFYFQSPYSFADRGCSKFPDNPEATHAFQKVSVAYDVLSTPSSKRIYDSRKTNSPYDFFTSRPTSAEGTFRGVILAVFNDFLDGDLELVRTLLCEHASNFAHLVKFIDHLNIQVP